MAARKKRKKAKIVCRGMRRGKKMVKRGTCKRSRCAGQMMGSTKGGKPKRRKRSVCLKAKRTRRAAPKRRKAAKRAVKRSVMRRGVKVGRKKVYGAAALAVAKKRARGGAKKKRARPIRGHYGRTIAGGGYEFTPEELRELERM